MSWFEDIRPLQLVQAALCILIIFYVMVHKLSPVRSLPLPPGPPMAGALSGHFSIIPTHHSWKAYTEWAAKFGNIIHLRIYHQRIILLADLDDCVEVFEKRSNLYSDRPTITMADLMGWDFNAGLMPYGPRWRRQRRLFQQHFKRQSALSYRSEQTRKVNDLLHGLLTSPEDFRDHARTASAATVMSIAYGYDVKQKKDHFVEIAEDASSRLALSVLPGAALVNAVPILRHLPSWFPGAGFHKLASETRELTTKMKDLPFEWVHKNMNEGTQHDCLVTSILPSCKTEQDVEALKEFAALSYAAGAETTTAALHTFFYAMTIFPDVQKKAQQELDDVVGRGRLPTFSDWESLPYIEALLREVLRWRPVFPLGVAHALTDDDVFKGYFIPKGSIVIANAWAMSRNERRYVNPESFKPERFFDQDGLLNDDDVEYTFGFGRRICPGRHMARATAWLSMATTLWAFQIAKPKDALGNDLPVHAEYSDGIASFCGPHACTITPRTPQTVEIIEEAVAQTKARLS